MCNLEYLYNVSGKKPSFNVGPISCQLNRGEIVFITGANGSGKSTLIKLITQLYLPHSGGLYLNQTQIEHYNRHRYQEMLGVIYQAPHIFNQILTFNIDKQQSSFQEYLRVFELEHKINVKNNTFENLEQLSYGQQKRLGLLIALMEDKPIYIFDEWAADQDTRFRKLFYSTLLPTLKSQGKAIIAVTHDKSYFNVADKVIVLNKGRQT